MSMAKTPYQAKQAYKEKAIENLKNKTIKPLRL